MKDFLTLSSIEDVYDIIKNLPPLSSEVVPIYDANGRYLNEDFIAYSDLPGFSRSIVDGYAARAADVFGASESSPIQLKCVASGSVGVKPDFMIGEGECAYIPTGGMLPAGADCVIMVEYCRKAKNDYLEIIRAEGPGSNIILANEDASKGDILMRKGSLIRPQEIGILASYGQEQIKVGRKPKIAIISSGNEIVPINAAPQDAQIRDVNSYTLYALTRKVNGEAKMLGIIGDEIDALQNIIQESLLANDIIVLSGGSSAGMRDRTLEAFTNIPGTEILVHGAAVRPGKPFIFAKNGPRYLLGLPGHVTSALITAQLFLVPLLQHLQGAANIGALYTLEATVDRSIASVLGRRDYIRCTLYHDNNILRTHPLMDSSATIMGMVKADGLITCPENSEGFPVGAKVPVILM